MKKLVALVVSMVALVACSSTPTGKETCERIESLCSVESDEGSISISDCDANELDKHDDAKDCIADADDCNGVFICMFSAAK